MNESTKTKLEVLHKPLPRTKATQVAGENNGRLQVIVEVGLEDLLHVEGVDGLNDFMDDKVLAGGMTLTDINYRIVGHIEGKTGGDFLSGSVLIEVNAEVQEL